MLLGGNTQLVVEGVVPYLLHVIPVGHNAVLNWILEGEDAPFGLGLISNVGVLLAHTHHDALVAGTAHNGGEDGPEKIFLVQQSLALFALYLGASSPAKPALHTPEPLSTTSALSAETSESIVSCWAVAVVRGGVSVCDC